MVGLKDRLNAAKRMMWSPITVGLLERGSDTVVRAGGTAKVVVDVEGEDDGTAERVEVTLVLNTRATVWLLGEVPATIGRHELEVQIPGDVPPSTPWTRYAFKGILYRSKGVDPEGVSPVNVIGSPEYVYWPDGPRAGSQDAGVAVELDAETVAVGDRVTGRVVGAGSDAITVEVGAVVDAFVHVEGRSNGQQKQTFKKFGEAKADAGGAFSIEVPPESPPTLHDGDKTQITWEARAGKAWHRFAVLDPEGLGFGDPERAMSLYELFF